MFSFPFSRMSGICLVVGGVFAALGWLLKFGLPSGGVSLYTNPLYLPACALVFCGSVFTIAGLPGLYTQLATRSRILSLLGIILSGFLFFVDVLGNSGGIFISFFTGHPDILKTFDQTNVLFIFPLLLLGFVGFLVLGIANLRARVFPVGVGALIITAFVGVVAGFVVPVVMPVGPVLLYAALAWSGLLIARNQAGAMPVIAS